jgi:hypothetical protein
MSALVLSWPAQNSDVLEVSYSNTVAGREYYLSYGNSIDTDYGEVFTPTSSSGTRTFNQSSQVLTGDGKIFCIIISEAGNPANRADIISYIIPGWGFSQSFSREDYFRANRTFPLITFPGLDITPVIEGISYYSSYRNLIFNVRNNTANRVAVQLVGYNSVNVSGGSPTFNSYTYTSTPVTTQISESGTYAGATIVNVDGSTPGTEIPAVVILPPGESSFLTTHWRPERFVEKNIEVAPYLFAATLSGSSTGPIGNIQGMIIQLPSKIKYVNSGFLLLGDLVSETCAITVIDSISLRLVVTNPISLPNYSYLDGTVNTSVYKLAIFNGSQYITMVNAISSTTKVGATLTYDYILDSASITKLNNLSAETPVNFGIIRGSGSGNLIADLVKFWYNNESGFVPPSISQKMNILTTKVTSLETKLTELNTYIRSHLP